MNRGKDYVGTSGVRRFICLMVLLGVVWVLAGDRLRSLGGSSSHGVEDGNVGQFDSFSESALATAVLKREAESLLFAYTQSRDFGLDAAYRLGAVQQSGASTADKSSIAASEGASAAQASIILSLEQLRGEIHERETDLDRKLMMAYYQSDRWNDFLDQYLRLSHESPRDSYVVEWAGCALGSARQCGRMDEIVQALEASPVHADPETVEALRTVLAEWGLKQPKSLTAANR
jgi:hypothetical protein